MFRVTYRMDFDDIVLRRQSCRSFDPARPAEPEAVDACLRAARLAPSAVNSQPYTMWVVTGDKAGEIRALRASFNAFLDNCSTFVLFASAPYNAGARAGSAAMRLDYRQQDIGEAVAYFTLKAADVGLDTCIVGSFPQKKVQKALGTRSKIYCMVAVGHAVEGYRIREKKRKPIEEIVRRTE